MILMIMPSMMIIIMVVIVLEEDVFNDSSEAKNIQAVDKAIFHDSAIDQVTEARLEGRNVFAKVIMAVEKLRNWFSGLIVDANEMFTEVVC